jgi:hypothetical protein
MGGASSASAVARKVLDKSPALDDVPDSYVDIVNDSSVDIDSLPLGDYGDYADDMEDGFEDDEFWEETNE